MRDLEYGGLGRFFGNNKVFNKLGDLDLCQKLSESNCIEKPHSTITIFGLRVQDEGKGSKGRAGILTGVVKEKRGKTWAMSIITVNLKRG